MNTEHHHGRVLLTLLCALVATTFATSALAAAAVTVTFPSGSITTAAPGGTVTAKATVTISDGSTLQSISWKQTGGVAITGLSGDQTDTVKFTLPDQKAFRNQMIVSMQTMPISASAFPAHVPVPDPYTGGLQDRFGVVGIYPQATANAGAILFDVTVVTTSGTYKVPVSVAAAKLPWKSTTGVSNVATKVPVVLNAPTQASYNWALTGPTGSTATLSDPASRNPEFTPDVAGTYTLTVTNLKTNAPVTLKVVAGTWKGIITGAAADGTPTVDSTCLMCHSGKLDKFTTWAKTGHAQVFAKSMGPIEDHYTEGCMACHNVGGADMLKGNSGIDEASDYEAFVKDAGLRDAKQASWLFKDDTWKTVVSKYPATARFTNIQCEVCHGPQDSTAHTQGTLRQNLSSDMCGSCHGRPPSHGRYQEWQLSGHGNYALAIEEGTNTSCGKCHSGQGFLQWMGNGFSDAALQVTWTADEVHPVTCAVCHDPHDEGTAPTAETNAKMRVHGNTPKLMAGFSATNVGAGAICMTCHNGRRGLKDDAHFSVADAARAPHQGPQADILMGQNLYFAKVGTPGFHAQVADSCVACHMEETLPPSTIGRAGQTNHTFYASNTICVNCHEAATATAVQGQVQAKVAALKSQIESALLLTMQNQIRTGNSLDIGGTKVTNANDLKAVALVESHGSQAITTTLANGTKVENIALGSVKVVRPGGSSVALYSVADPAIAKAGWNYMMIEADKSDGVHNPAFVNSALDISAFALTTILNGGSTAGVPGGGTNAGLAGGLGNGAGAVSCTTPYVYWAEIAAHSSGIAGSQWRTDLITRNLSGTNAALKFYLHQNGAANLEGSGSVTASSQKAFEDVVALLGGTSNLGSLEICSDQPLLVTGRIFNQSDAGTFGQNLDGSVANLGYVAGQTVSLIGLRQKTDAFRSNISVTNAGKTDAQVTIALYDATGAQLLTYDLGIPAGVVLQDTEPFKNRANKPDLDWGFATVTVINGTNILTSASMIDMKTNDPTTIQPKQ